MQLAQPPRDELRVLRPEINDDNRLMRHWTVVREALASAVASREYRYYKRVVRATTTTGWGLAVGIAWLLSIVLILDAQTPAKQEAAEPEAPTPVWQIELDPLATLWAVAGPSAIFVAGGTPPLRAFAIEDGTLLWSGEARADAHPVAGDASLFLLSPRAVEARDATDGSLRWSSALPDGIPLAASGNGVLAVGVGTSLFFFQADDGAGIASATLDAPLSLAPLISDDLVAAVTEAGTMTGLDTLSARRRWTTKLPAPVQAMSAYSGRLYLSDEEGGLGCYLASNGQMEWRFSLYSRASGAPALDERHVYVALYDNTVQAIDRISGSRRWHQTLSGRPVTPVWPVGDRLFVVQADGVVTVLAAANGARVARLAPTDEARRLEAGGLLQTTPPAAFTLTTGTSTTRRLSLWRPQS